MFALPHQINVAQPQQYTLQVSAATFFKLGEPALIHEVKQLLYALRSSRGIHLQAPIDSLEQRPGLMSPKGAHRRLQGIEDST
ncbi:MAG: hypothetical protein R3268_13950, partial [Acidiferrobacterales bacterium]|nr:hypothetical protein [Acidiferrobacterales bacterium]